MKLLYPLCWPILLACFVGCTDEPGPGKQILMTEGFSNQVMDAYWLYLPREYNEQKKWPMIMFLEGGDAAASPNPNAVKDGGPVNYLLPQQSNLPDSFIIVNPHMRSGTREQRQWYQHADALMQIINQTITKYHVDPDRVYLTGRSRGGHGTWGVARRFPEKLAAVVPIAGAINCKSNCDKMVNLPMWIIHNEGDPVVDYSYAQTTVNYLENELGKAFLKTSGLDLDQDIRSSKALFTTFDSDQHGGAGAQVYASPQFYDWLLSNRRD